MYLNLFLTGKRMTPIAHIKLMKTQRCEQERRKERKDPNKATKKDYLWLVIVGKSFGPQLFEKSDEDFFFGIETWVFFQ